MERSKVQIGLGSSDRCRSGEHSECVGVQAPLDLTSDLSMAECPVEILVTVCSCSCHWIAWDAAQLTRSGKGVWRWNG